MFGELERLSHLLGRFFGLGSSTGFGYLSFGVFIKSRCVARNDYLEKGYLVSERGSGVKAIQSVSRLWTFDFSRGW